jgi:hypothetical protein
MGGNIMSEKLAKHIRKQVNKKAAEIKTQGVKDFLEFTTRQSLRKRFIFAIRVIFKKLKP